MSADSVGEQPREALAVLDDEIAFETHIGPLEATRLSVLALGTTDEPFAPDAGDAYALENNTGQLPVPELPR